MRGKGGEHGAETGKNPRRGAVAHGEIDEGAAAQNASSHAGPESQKNGGRKIGFGLRIRRVV
jgi:hypothetical protein